MTYSITITGHGANADDAKGVFADTVRALRAINGDNAMAMASGQISGSDDTGQSFSMSAAEVIDLEAADTDDGTNGTDGNDEPASTNSIEDDDGQP